MSEGEDKEKIAPAKRSLKHRCTTCFRYIEGESYALCIKCKGFVQCLQCLAEGIEKGAHLREHPFIIIDPKLNPIFRTDWTSEEETLFLDAIQTYGLGNYIDVEALIPFKSAAEYESHYASVYFGSPLAPKPEQVVLGRDDPAPPPSYPTSPVPSRPSDGNDEILKLAGKKEPETPGEVACFMPMRQEFEWEFKEPAEELICNISFDVLNETLASFESKMSRLCAYSNLVEDRDIRTKTAIDFELQKKAFALPNGPEDHIEASQKLLSLAPYFGKKSVMELIELVKMQLDKKSLIETRIKWQANGVRSHAEGFLFAFYEKLIANGKITNSDIEKWNKKIEDYQRTIGQTETPESHLLDLKEAELCRNESIPTQLYLALKDLILREFAIRGSLSRDECIELDASNATVLDLMYDLFLNVGWICE